MDVSTTSFSYLWKIGETLERTPVLHRFGQLDASSNVLVAGYQSKHKDRLVDNLRQQMHENGWAVHTIGDVEDIFAVDLEAPKQMVFVSELERFSDTKFTERAATIVRNSIAHPTYFVATTSDATKLPDFYRHASQHLVFRCSTKDAYLLKTMEALRFSTDTRALFEGADRRVVVDT